MKTRAGPGPGRLRRPARGGALAEFVVGLIAGMLASFIISLSFDAGSPSPDIPLAPSPRSHVSQTGKDALPSLNKERDKDDRPVIRDGEWQPKERLPGYKDPRIACIVTQSLQEEIIPAIINATWGSRCDRLIFPTPRMGISIEKLEPFEQVKANKPSNKDVFWTTYRSIFKNVEIRDSDYFIIVDDRTYAVPDNVRYEFRGFTPGEDPLFWGRKAQRESKFFGADTCMADFFVLSRKTLTALKAALEDSRHSACGEHDPNDLAGPRINACLSALGTPCKYALDFQGKEQIMDDPVQLLSKSDVPAHLIKGSACCSVLPLAFLNVGKMISIRTGTFSYHYFYDYFIRDTAVFGREYMRPLNGIDAGVGKPQIGF